MLNVVHAHAPGARICFNTTPADSLEAVAPLDLSRAGWRGRAAWSVASAPTAVAAFASA